MEFGYAKGKSGSFLRSYKISVFLPTIYMFRSDLEAYMHFNNSKVVSFLANLSVFLNQIHILNEWYDGYNYKTYSFTNQQ